MQLLRLAFVIATANALAVKSSPKKKAPKAKGGFGAPPKPVKAGKQISGEKLLYASEDRYNELEKKYDGDDDDDADDALVLRDFVVALRSSKAAQFSDWMPVCVLGVVSAQPADSVVPWAVSLHRRFIVEAMKDVAGGRAGKLAWADFEISSEPLVDFEKRVLDVVQADVKERGAENEQHKATLLLDVAYDAVGLKAAYRSRCKEAHPDVRVSDDVPDINACRVAFEALGADLERVNSGATYESLGGAAKSFTVLDVPAATDAPFPGEAAATRVDPDMCLPFLLRNVQREGRRKDVKI